MSHVIAITLGMGFTGFPSTVLSHDGSIDAGGRRPECTITLIWGKIRRPSSTHANPNPQGSPFSISGKFSKMSPFRGRSCGRVESESDWENAVETERAVKAGTLFSQTDVSDWKHKVPSLGAIAVAAFMGEPERSICDRIRDFHTACWLEHGAQKTLQMLRQANRLTPDHSDAICLQPFIFRTLHAELTRDRVVPVPIASARVTTLLNIANRAMCARFVAFDKVALTFFNGGPTVLLQLEAMEAPPDKVDGRYLIPARVGAIPPNEIGYASLSLPTARHFQIDTVASFFLTPHTTRLYTPRLLIHFLAIIAESPAQIDSVRKLANDTMTVVRLMNAGMDDDFESTDYDRNKLYVDFRWPRNFRDAISEIECTWIKYDLGQGAEPPTTGKYLTPSDLPTEQLRIFIAVDIHSMFRYNSYNSEDDVVKKLMTGTAVQIWRRIRPGSRKSYTIRDIEQFVARRHLLFGPGPDRP